MAMAVKKQSLSASAPSSEWPDKAVSVLLKTYAEKFSADRGYLRTQDWQDVAFAVNCVCSGTPKTLKQCRDKVDSLKRRYKIEKRRAITGGDVSWPFFHRLDDIMNSVLKQGKMHYSKLPYASSAHGSADADDADEVEEGVEFRNEGEKVGEAAGEVGVQERRDLAGVDGNGDDAQRDEKQDESYSQGSLSASSADIPPYLFGRRIMHQRHTERDYNTSEDDDIDDYTFNGYPYRRIHHYPFGESAYHGGDRYYGSGQCRPHSLCRSERMHNYPLSQHPQLPEHPKPCTFSGGTQESTENSSHGRVRQVNGHKRKFGCDNGIDALADAVTGLSKPGRSSTFFTDMFARIEQTKREILKKVRSEVTKLDKSRRKNSTASKANRSHSSSY
ncbi:hypothetical protein KP509_16G004000 [Ceratopteris richardii]|uniref:Myb/SANT-like DNA-binding domain-containing protein n=1 Tax=Ceratopteris richardii TaxID=49495 RepID=A0A8T2SZW6_CERRI|nr:hypothetical protein KP509_16G004000 [Ceratopteris richardii]